MWNHAEKGAEGAEHQEIRELQDPQKAEQQKDVQVEAENPKKNAKNRTLKELPEEQNYQREA